MTLQRKYSCERKENIEKKKRGQGKPYIRKNKVYFGVRRSFLRKNKIYFGLGIKKF